MVTQEPTRPDRVSIIEWKNPLPPPPRRVDRVAAELRSRPGEWALIARSTGIQFLPWWTPFYKDPKYQIKSVATNSDQPFGTREIYARFIEGGMREVES